MMPSFGTFNQPIPKKDLPAVIYGPQGQEFILIPAGPFLMGSTEEELQQLATEWGDPAIIQQANLHLETPQHEVNLEAFYIGKYPVTNAEKALVQDCISLFRVLTEEWSILRCGTAQTRPASHLRMLAPQAKPGTHL